MFMCCYFKYSINNFPKKVKAKRKEKYNIQAVILGKTLAII